MLGFLMSFLHTMMRMRRVITLAGGIGCAASSSPGASAPFLRGATYGDPDTGNLAPRPVAGLFRPSSISTSPLAAAAASTFLIGVTVPLTPEVQITDTPQWTKRLASRVWVFGWRNCLLYISYLLEWRRRPAAPAVVRRRSRWRRRG